MDPNPNSFPIVSYLMEKLHSIKRPGAGDSSEFDIELQSPTHFPSSSSVNSEPFFDITEKMPHLTDPNVIAEMRSAVAEVAQTRSVLKTLGDRPDHETVDKARIRLAEIELKLNNERDETGSSEKGEGSTGVEKEKDMCKAIISFDEMHDTYEKLLMEAEEKLEKIYDAAVAGRGGANATEEVPASVEEEEVDEEVIRILQAASVETIERIDLSGRQLRLLPESFGKIPTLVVLNLSSNNLKVIPDSIAGLGKLEELNISSNVLESLPESVGLLLNLKVLDVSRNMLTALPDSICHCRSLVELDSSYNKLTYLPTNIGYELVNLKRLSIQLNKIRSLPTSIGEMSSLCHLDVHFNELRGLPLSIGRLINLEVLNLSSNFSDLTELPETFGDMKNLKELDLSNNQIHELPMTFCRLDNLIKLNLQENPLVIPPKEVVNEGVEAVKTFMSQRRLSTFVEEEEHTPDAWLNRSTSWLKDSVSVVTDRLSGYLGVKEKSAEEPYLNQQF